MPLRSTSLVAPVLAGACLWPVAASALPATADPPFVISAVEDRQYGPAIAWDPFLRRYLVTWHEGIVGTGSDVRAAFVASDGQVEEAFTVSAGVTARADPDVAIGPANARYLVAWSQDYDGNGSDWDLWGTLLPRGGPTGGEVAFPIDDELSSQLQPAVAYAITDQRFLVAWTDLPAPGRGGISSVRGRLVEGDGSGFVGSSFAISTGPDSTAPDIAFDQTRYQFFVVWTQINASSDVYGAFVTVDGAIVPPGPFGIAAWPGLEHSPSVDRCLGIDQYLVAWQAQDEADEDVYARRVAGDGTVVGAPIAINDAVPSRQEAPRVACRLAATGGDDYLVVFEQQYSNDSGPFGVWGQMVRWDGTTRPPFAIVAPVGAAERVRPAVAAGTLLDSRNAPFLVGWQQLRATPFLEDVWGAFAYPQVVFADGFESGNTLRWSETSP